MVRLDPRGHGLSDKLADPAAFQDGKIWAEDIRPVISALRLSRPVLAGWSYGGFIICAIRIRYSSFLSRRVGFREREQIVCHVDVVFNTLMPVPRIIYYSVHPDLARTSNLLLGYFFPVVDFLPQSAFV